MKALVTFLSLMAITLTASADPMGEKFALSCSLNDGQITTTEARLKQVSMGNGELAKIGELTMNSGNLKIFAKALGNDVEISTISASAFIRARGTNKAELEIRPEGTEGADITLTCKLTN